MKLLSQDKLDKHLRNQAAQGVIGKGTDIVRWGKYKLIELIKEGGGVATYKVQSTQYSNLKYEVVIRNFLGPEPVISSCTCAYDWGGICKHQAAMLMVLSKNEIMTQPAVLYSMSDSIVYLPDLTDANLRYNTADENWKNRHSLRSVEIQTALNGIAECTVHANNQHFTLRFVRVQPGEIRSACSCGETGSEPLCAHKLAALLALRDRYGIHAFTSMRDWTLEKNQMLSPYGFSVDDDLRGKFDFKITDNGKLEMTVLDKTIQSPEQLGQWWQSNRPRIASAQIFKAPVTTPEEETGKRILLYAFSPQDENALPDVALTPLSARYQPDKDKLSHLNKLEGLYTANNPEVPVIGENDSRLINLTKSGFGVGALLSAIRDAGFPMPRWQYATLPLNELSEETRIAAQAQVGRTWDQLLPLLHDKMVVYSPNQQFQLGALTRIHLHRELAKPFFRLQEDGDFAVLEAFVALDGASHTVDKYTHIGFWWLRYRDTMVKIATYEDAAILRQFGPSGKIKVRKVYLSELLSNFVLPLAEQFTVEFNISKPIEYQPLTYLGARIYLKEDESNLLFVPAFAYQDPASPGAEMECTIDGKRDRIAYENEQITVWGRDVEAEKSFYAELQAMNPDFDMQAGSSFFYLPFADVMKGQWLFHFFEDSKTRNIPVFGFNQLKKFKYNPNRPAFKIRASSGIDWFDMKMEISFGEQFVSLADVRKAVLNKQSYVQLGDGSIGMLPEEWLEKYASLFKFGQVKGDSLKISKMHFSLIDELYAQIDDEKVLREIQDKKQKLLYFREIQDIPLPANIQANLRDYQVEGFKWLNFLDEFNWGGCLADDMGLGKTLQILTFLQHCKNQAGPLPNLIVMPTTLLFNWQAEVKKFAPELRIHIHRGVDRHKNPNLLRDVDLVLTTYGTLRSDIEQFKDFPFQYVVLDESQAIKNPDSKIAKAVKLLSARNRLVMTGTPVENNTFDLFSQMDFLNPGLLGSQEFFRAEFANPIDKFRDEEKARELRKIIYPFILKRTKEEVAKDLPDKTETVLYCEMEPRQRKVYETFRDLYRQKIVHKMAEEGKDKAAFLILEGLLKLRQICDSPALLSDEGDYGDESAKLEEIIREIEENAGHHKILIFSQFLKMLDLIRVFLEKDGIPYEYLDGSTRDRGERVRNFQETDQCRVFLMSLKAGGVGINLTEADYVYLVDPWWNPAVEQQAIDRTHRIGQTKKVFAYKMICKDTVEEKILQLQEKKKDIAKEIISTEQGLIKKLSKEDIVGLFS